MYIYSSGVKTSVIDYNCLRIAIYLGTVCPLAISSGTDVNLLDHSGRTPLHCAASRLKFLQENKQFTSFQFKEEVTQVC